MSSSYNTYHVTSGPNATLLAPAGTPYLLFNADENNNVYICDTDSPNLSGSGYTILRPLGYLAVTGAIDTYGIVIGATVIVEASAFAIQGQPSPVDIALQIASAGIPSIDDPAPLMDSPEFNVLIAAGATESIGPITVKQYQSWFGKFFLTATSAGVGTNPFSQWEMAWSVASDNYDPLETDDWFVPNTPYNFEYNYINQGKGFVIGDSLTLNVTNLDTEPVDLTFGLFGSYRTRIRQQVKGLYQWISASGLPNPALGLNTDDIVYINGNVPAIAAGTTLPLLNGYSIMNLWEGPVTISGNLMATALGMTVIITPLPVSNIGLHPVIGGYVIKADASGIIVPTTIILPRRVCGITISNATGAATNAGGYLVVTGQVQPE